MSVIRARTHGEGTDHADTKDRYTELVIQDLITNVFRLLTVPQELLALLFQIMHLSVKSLELLESDKCNDC